MADFETTTDAFLGGEVMLVQPAKGFHRSGSDAVLLAATIQGEQGAIVDLGAGCGAIGLMVAEQNPDADITLAECDPIMLACCAKSLERNPTLAKRTKVLDVDVLASEPKRLACGLNRAAYDHVVTNPPYRRAGHVRTAAYKEAAHVIDQDQLAGWMRTAAGILKPGGTLTMIFGADGLPDVINSMEGRFGAITILGLHPAKGKPAERILVRGIKGRKTPTAILPGLILHGEDGRYTPQVDSVLRGQGTIRLAY